MNGVDTWVSSALACLQVFFGLFDSENMAQEFEIGSIADLVNKSGTKIKKNKKMAKAEVETPVVTPKKRLSKRKSSEFEVTDVEPENDSSKVISKRTKKIKKLDVTAEPEAEVAAPTPKKKNKKKKPNVSQEAISPKVENTKNVSNDEGSQEKLTRTVFIGNLPANFHLKVRMFRIWFRLNQFLHLGFEEETSRTRQSS